MSNLSQFYAQLGELSPANMEVLLLAATKGRTVEEINQYVEDFRKIIDPAFQSKTIIGESYVQEMLEKRSLLRGVDEVHFIGRIQSNKVPQMIKDVAVLHSVGREKLLKVIETEVRRQGALPQKIYLQVNISDDGAKDGFQPDEVGDVIRYVRGSNALELSGLMTITRLYDDPENSFDDYCRLVDLGKRFGVSSFSMGMSGDYQVAIRAGVKAGAESIMLRIGSLLFG
jgi:pyridoxal phosphate enzyme (YggS family)